MSFILDQLGFAAVDLAVEKAENQITFVNFIAQAMPLNILTLIEGCSQNFGFLFGVKQINNTHKKDAYLILYDYLVEKNVIKQKTGVATFFILSKVYTVNRNYDMKNLKNVIENDKNNKKYPELLNCFTINHMKLINFLKNYMYKAENEYKVLTTGGKKTKSKRRSRRLKKVKELF
uniref:Uncharacterized protein n=1 Tax=viral metagenome TaxID=1070528 RepID=A0A6C0EZ48_9ZZZZ